MRMFLVLTLLVSAAAWAKHPKLQAIPGTESDKGSYYQLTNSNFDRFIVTSKNALKGYKKVHFFPMTFDQMEIVKSRRSDIDRSWRDVTPQELKEYTGHFDRIALKQFGNNEAFEVVDKPENDTLVIQFRMKSYMPLVHREGTFGDKTVGAMTQDQFGSITADAILVDATTREVKAMLEDGLRLEKGMSRASKDANFTVWQRAFKYWVSKLEEDLALMQ